MSNKIYVSQNGLEKEATGKNLEYILSWQADVKAEQGRIEAEQTAKAQARESAMAKLKKLGLTDEEIASLVP